MEVDKLIFTFEDVKTVRKVSNNITDFEDYALEVQSMYIQKLIGDPLYIKMTGDPGAARFAGLINGARYKRGAVEVIYRGLKYYACYLWLYIYSRESGASITPIGVQTYVDDDSDPSVGKTAYKNATNHYLAMADAQEECILAFLDAHSSQYPEFSHSKRIEPAEEDNIVFNVSPKLYKPPY